MPQIKTLIFSLIILSSNISCKDRLSTEATMKSSEPLSADAIATICSGTKNDSDKSAPSLTLPQLPPKAGDKITYKNRDDMDQIFTVTDVKFYRCPFCFAIKGCIDVASIEDCKDDSPNYAVINTMGSLGETGGRKMKSSAFQFKNANNSPQNLSPEVMDNCNEAPSN